MIKNKCLQCNKEFESYKYMNQKFCSRNCYHLNARGKPLIGKALISSRQSIKKAVDERKNNPEVREKWILKMKEITLGPKNHKWIEDRSLLVNQDERNCYEYRRWSYEVKCRDNYKCKIADENCEGRLEVHHILSWKDFPELHYKINNGITLCHAHHPRVRSEEKRLIPTFEELVSVSKA